MPIHCFIPSITIDDRNDQKLVVIAGKAIESLGGTDYPRNLSIFTVCLDVDQDPPPPIRVNNGKFPAIEKFIKDQIESASPKLPSLIQAIKTILANSNGGKLPVGWKISKITLTAMGGDLKNRYCRKECGGGKTPAPDDVAGIQEWNNLFTDDNKDLSKVLEEAQVNKNPDAPLAPLPQQPIVDTSTKISLGDIRAAAPCHIGNTRDISIVAAVPIKNKFLIESEDLHAKIAENNMNIEPLAKDNNIYKARYKNILGNGDRGSDSTYKLKTFNADNLKAGLEKTHICNNTYLKLPGGAAETLNEEDKVKGTSNIKNNISSIVSSQQPDIINIKLNRGSYNPELQKVLVFVHGDTTWKDNNPDSGMMISLPKKVRIQQPSSILRVPLEINIDALVKVNITKLSLPLVKEGFNIGKNPFEEETTCNNQSAGTVEILDKRKKEKIKLSETKIRLSTTVYVDYALDITKSKKDIVPPKQQSNYYGKNPSFNNSQIQPLGSLRIQVGLMRFRNESAQISKETFAQVLLDYAGPPTGYYFIDNNLIFNNPDSYWINFEDDLIQKIPTNARVSSLFDNLQGKTIDEIRSIIIAKADIFPRYIANIPSTNNKTSGSWNLPINRDKTPLLGEPGYESDTGKLKIGDGTSTWGDLNPVFTGYVDDIPKDIWLQLDALYQKQSIFFIGTRPQLQYFIDTKYYADKIQPDAHAEGLLKDLAIPNPPAAGQRIQITGSKNGFPYGALSHNRPVLGGGDAKTNPFDNLTDQVIDYENNNIFLSLTEQIAYNFKHANKFTINDPSGKNFTDIVGRSFNLEQQYKDKIIKILEQKATEKSDSCCCYEYTIGVLVNGKIIPVIPSNNIEFDLEIEYIDSTKNKKLLK